MKRWIPVALLLVTMILQGFTVNEMPSIKQRVSPDVDATSVYSYHNAIARAKQGVVNISTQKKVRQQMYNSNPMLSDPFFRRFFGDMFNHVVPQERVERSLGSGVVISKEGHIVTNNHVIEGADTILVSLPNDKKEYEAKLVGRDPKSDLAVVKIEAENLSPVGFGNSDELLEGDVVFAIGNPFGVGETVTQGIVSALNKSGIGINDYENFIQTDASINPGNSGGALIDSRGALIGINTAILSKTGGNHGIGFAIPSNMARQVITMLIEEGEVERGYLGVSIQDITEDLRDIYNRDDGAVIVSIAKDSPADEAGMQRGDLVVEVDGKKISGSADLKNTIGSFRPNQKVEIEIIRDRQRETLTVKLDKLGGAFTTASGNTTVFDGVVVAPMTNELRSKYNIPKRIEGVVIIDIEAGSTAEKLAFREGDVIVWIESQLINDIEDLKRALTQYDKRRKRVFINRQGSDGLVVVP